MDYAALGLTVVASDVPAYRSIVRHREIILVPNEPDRWRHALRAVIRDPGLRHKMAAQARAAVR